MADGEEEIEKPLRLKRGTLQQVLWTEKDGAIFGEHGDGNDRLKARVWQAREQGVGSSGPGTGCRNGWCWAATAATTPPGQLTAKSDQQKLRNGSQEPTSPAVVSKMETTESSANSFGGVLTF
jgi:hypothetical protein